MQTRHLAAALCLAVLAPVAFGDYTSLPTILSPPATGSDVGHATLNEATAATSGQQAGSAQVNGSSHAYYWTGSAPGTDYNGTHSSSVINALSSTQAVGSTGDPSQNTTAAAWTLGNPTPQPLLTSNGSDIFTNTVASGIGASFIAGSGNSKNAGQTHALVWTSPAATPTDLHTSTPGFASLYTQSLVGGADGNHVVGYGTFTADTSSHAILWDLSAPTPTYTDLHDSATDLQSSQAVAISKNQVVGYGLTDEGNTQALLWTLGPGDSITYNTLVTPDDFNASVASATNGSIYVGAAINLAGSIQAVVWTSPMTYQFLPTPDGDTAEALGVDADGDIVGTLHNSVTNQTDAVVWTPNSSPVPEPASLALLLPAAVLLCRRRNAMA